MYIRRDGKKKPVKGPGKRRGVPPEADLQAAAEQALMQTDGVLLPEEFRRQLAAVAAGPAPLT